MDEKKLHKALDYLKSALKEIKDVKNEIDMSTDRDTFVFASNWDVSITRTIGEIEIAIKKELKLRAKESLRKKFIKGVEDYLKVVI